MEKNPVIQTMIETVATAQNTTTEDISNIEWISKRHGKSKRCPAHIAVAKQIVCYLAIKYPVHYNITSMREVGRAIGHKDHYHVRRYYTCTKNRMSVDTEFCHQVTEIEAEFMKNIMCAYSSLPNVLA